MAKAAPLISSFNSGELSPLLDGRVDFAKYPNGASIMQNFIPTVQGPIRRRGGTRFIAEVKDSSDYVYLRKFEFSVTQAYVLEFGQNYIRFYTSDPGTNVRGRLESPPGTPVEVVTPYSTSDIFNLDKTCRLQFAQSADVLYITHPNYPPQELRRTSPTTFTLATFQNQGGPWDPINITATTIYASAESGSVTLNASAPVFSVNDVGNIFYLEAQAINSVLAWEVGKTVAIADRRRSDGKVYEALTAGVTGSSRPVHTEGALFDGDEVQWLYRDTGYGYARITAYGDPLTVTATVVDRFPAQVVGIANATTRWAPPAWRFYANPSYPSSVAFHRERLFFARGQRVWSSVSADFDDFHPLNFGQVTDDMAISLTVQSGEINDIQWLISERELLMGTAGAEFTLGELQNGDPLGPGNVRVKLQSRYGSRTVLPVVLGESTLFVQRAGLKAREIFYEFSSDGYKSTDTTVLAEHITASGIIDIDLAKEPDPIVWCVLTNGNLVGFTWNNEQEVRGWHPHPIGGGGVVDSVAIIPAPEGDRDDVWMVVGRYINGVYRRYVEYMERPRRTGDPMNTQFYVDSGLTYSGIPNDTISGLDHLEGATLDVLADGAPHPQVVVVGGSVTLQREYMVVNLGLPAPCRWRSMRIEAGAQDGTAQAKTKRFHKMSYRFVETAGGKFGVEGKMDYFQFRSPSDPMDQPVPLFSGDKTVNWPEGYSTDGYIEYTNDQPTQVTLAAVFPQIVTQDSR